MLNASKHEARPKISSPNPLRRIRRAVEDYDFDRLEVEAQQCVKLTSTNRPFGLIIKLSQLVIGEQIVKSCRERAKQRQNAFVITVRSASSRTCNASQLLLSRSRAMSRSLLKYTKGPPKKARVSSFR